MSIYDEIEEHMNAAMMVVDNHPLPAKFVDYMDHRIKALGRVEARAHDSRNLHLSWEYYYFQLVRSASMMDDIGWEILYDNLSEETGFSIATLHALELQVVLDSAKQIIICSGYKPFILDDQTRPECIPIAYELDLDITELKPPCITHDLESLDDTLVINTHAGDDVSLA